MSASLNISPCEQNMISCCRTCPVCQKTFQTKRGLRMHCSGESKASQCYRHQEITGRASIIKANRERRAASKKAKISNTDFTSWKGNIAKGTHFSTVTKTVILNLISVRTF